RASVGAAAAGATWGGEPAIDGARATGRRPAQSFSRHSGDGARRPGGLHHPRQELRSSAGEDMGRIVDIIVSRDGQVHAAIIDFGGFLGIGMRKIAVDWHALNFAPAGKPGLITLELTRNQVRLAPEYKRGEPVVVVGAVGAERMPSSEVA